MTTTCPDLCFIVTKLSQFMCEAYEESETCFKIYERNNKPTINI